MRHKGQRDRIAALRREIVEMRERGMNQAEMGEILGMQAQTVGYHCRALGLKFGTGASEHRNRRSQ